MMKVLTWSAVIVIGLFMAACGKQKTDVSLRLTHSERERIDSIYTNRLDSLRPVWDSLCDTRYSNNLTHAVDSIVTERIEEEARLRSRLPNQ